MDAYQIVRIERRPCASNTPALHVVAVATGNLTLYDRVWSADEVLEAIEAGGSFYTQSATSKTSHPVQVSRCDKCSALHVQLVRFDGPTVIFPPHW